MTQRRKQKRKIRARMARTGEPYSTARAVLLGRARTKVARPPVVMVPVSGMPRAIAFYSDALGFTTRATNADDTWAELSSDAAALGLHLGGQPGADTGLGLIVTDLAATCREVLRHGGRVIDGAQHETVVTISDPDGNLLRLMSTRNGSAEPSA